MHKISPPVSTYRLQITSSFDLARAAETLGYLHDLGVDWVYVSPLLAAEPGSNHGYDVVDHGTVDESRGGSDGLASLSAAAHALGMGVLVDIVPNHVGVESPAVNRWWWDVLQHGLGSRFADAFDIDWDAADGRLRIPVLGDDTDQIRIEDGEVHYHEHRFPLRADTDADAKELGTIHDVLAHQHYELIHWRRADSELNYRRFFAVSSLAAIRVEEPWVFDESHREILRWIEGGLVDGLRVDHPDGLLDPGAYLDRLAERTGGAYTLVEKILEGDEQLPPGWRTDGTTGYDFLGDVDRVLIDPNGEQTLNDIASWLGGHDGDWHELVHDCKRDVTDFILNSEMRRLARDVQRHEASGVPWPDDELVDAISELAACFPVYRSYLPDGREHLNAAFDDARSRRRDLATVFDRLVPVLGDPTHPAAVRFQQTSGMVMAKGVEDRAFYRWNRLGSLTEVGGDPDEFAIPVATFHVRQLARHERRPRSMTTLSTHDTKRGEDVRARLDVLSELPEVWSAFLANVRPNDAIELLVWQAIVGAWPASRERLTDYTIKAAREAGLTTSWNDVDEAAEARLLDVVDRAFDDATTRALLEGMVATVRGPGWSNSLTAKLVQLTAPGVPDVYQGSERWEMSLVDPDNRRPIDFAERRHALRDLDGPSAALPPIDETGRAKLLVTTRALRARRDRPELFAAYTPLDGRGSASDHLVAFDRGGAVTVATRLPVGLQLRGGWDDATMELPSGPHRDAITRRVVDGGTVRVGDLLADYPVALMLPLATEDEPAADGV